ncbi:putative ubiquitin-protein ligase [Maudiozyma humilis]|uniref:HECT-type E3 ubiquitin transferase n=1 Tax=Maudiozyma humilis TaxID=51915 RepID=A0AAV5RQ81_MAUHU|nr:putative ubiquitin-protein ligase [Kazachstania humilis]
MSDHDNSFYHEEDLSDDSNEGQYNDYGDESDDYNSYHHSGDENMDTSSHEDDNEYEDDDEMSDDAHTSGHFGRAFPAEGEAFNPAAFFQQLASGGNAPEGRRNMEEMLPGLLSMLNGGRPPSGGMGMGMGMGAASSRDSRIKSLVDNVLNANDDPYIAMESLKELSENMLMMNQIIVDRVIPTERLLKGVVDILSSPFLAADLELQMQACRCLYNLFEVIPESISMAVDSNIISILKGKLAEINFIDLAEQVLETVEFISRLHGKDILKCGDLACYIQYFDFFTIHAQRKAIAIVSNACAKVDEDDFDIIKGIFGTIGPILENVTDKNILSRLLNLLCGVCAGIQEADMLESIFTPAILKRLLVLTSGTEISLEDKLQSFSVLSVIVGNSRTLSKSIIEMADVADLILQCLNKYSKNQNGALHETLMFVPGEMLLAVSRFVTLLFPPENNQVLSKDKPKYSSPLEEDVKIEKLIGDLTPIFVEIFMNSMDYTVREYVLIALSRFLSSLTNATDKKVTLDESLIRLVGSTLAQNRSILSDNNVVTGDKCVLVLGALTLTDELITTFGEPALLALKREGIVELIKPFLQISSIFASNSKFEFEAVTKDVSEEDDDEEDDDEDDYLNAIGSDFDIPEIVRPRRIRFHVLKDFYADSLIFGISDISEKIINNSNTTVAANDSDLGQVAQIVSEMNGMNITTDDYESIIAYWSLVKQCIFRENFTLSSFEVISTGLAKEVSTKVRTVMESSDLFKRALLEVFSSDLSSLVEILQASLTRVETFEIIDCGLPNDENGMESLGKQLTIELVPDTANMKANFAGVLQTTTISIQCISSFKTCCEFLKNRLLNASFVNTLVGRNEPGGISSDDLRAIKSLNDKDFSFQLCDQEININDTIFGAVFNHELRHNRSVKDIWSGVHTIRFSIKCEAPTIEELTENEDDMNNTEDSFGIIDSKDENGSLHADDMMIDSIYDSTQPKEQDKSSAGDVMQILKFLHANMENNEIFINSKLSAKLSKQLDEPLIIASGALPQWTMNLTKEFSFLFPFETRVFFLQCVSYGYGRLIQIWKNKTESLKDISSDNPIMQLGRITRHKLRIPREKVFMTGLKVLERYGSIPSILEMEYQGEVGTGLGPTLEFYATMSKEFTQKSLNMWRDDEYNSKIDENPDTENNQYIDQTLFPRTIKIGSSNIERINQLFSYLGTLIARSMLDNRIVDFNFNPLFFSLAHELARNGKLPDYSTDLRHAISLVTYIDKQIGNSLRYIYENKESNVKLEQLYLTFVVPGTDTPLIDDGNNITVTSSNVINYMDLLVSSMIGDGILSQLQSFIDGFSKVFPYVNLLILEPVELVDMFGHEDEDWSFETLCSSVVADHGYTMDSPTIHDLISIMSELSHKDRRLFSQFLTGSPRLPLGGFKSLKPKFTVVLKHAEDGLESDQYLPSVMTCANYLKLPKYSSRKIMRTRIQQAIEEGAGAFLLS